MEPHRRSAGGRRRTSASKAITWIPDTFLRRSGFFDETQGPTTPTTRPTIRTTGRACSSSASRRTASIYAYALDHVGGGFTRIATIASGFPGVMDLQFDRELNDLWAICDDTLPGHARRSSEIDAGTGQVRGHARVRPAQRDAEPEQRGLRDRAAGGVRRRPQAGVLGG